jgi:hypothetical protein
MAGHEDIWWAARYVLEQQSRIPIARALVVAGRKRVVHQQRHRHHAALTGTR